MKFIIILLLSTYSILIAQKESDNIWLTKFEKTGFQSTCNYNETIDYFQNIADQSEFAQLFTIGTSPQGRELKCLIVSKDKIFDPVEASQSGNAIILINNGIHSGEIEGKDASMLMLREMLISKEKSNLLENVILLVIPVFNVDGHERSSPYGRINQNGPTEMGWRTTAQNLNLNRDFAKADSPEMKAFLNLYSAWLPDIFIDVHTTNGADYQYTITYAISKHKDVPPETQKFVNDKLIPFFEKDVNEAGYLIAPYVGFVDGDFSNGIKDWVAGPRFSNGYASVQNRIGLLVETHMLKSYKDRVFSTKALLESIIFFSNKNNLALTSVSRNADEYVFNKYILNNQAYPITFKITKDSDEFNFKGFTKTYKNSIITDSQVLTYSDKKSEKVVPYFNKSEILDSVFIPKAYLIPREWSSLIEIMKLHGIQSEQITKTGKLIVEKYKFKNVKYSTWSYEGRQIPSYQIDIIKDTISTNKGDLLINTNQRSLGMIVHLLEPKANDSFVKWGFMNIIFERKEYFEEYSMEPIAQKMYTNSEKLRTDFNDLINSDSTFAGSPRQRLNFFYERSPYYDEKHNVYPILRVVE